MKVEEVLDYIFGHIFLTYGERAELRAGVWDESYPHTFYAHLYHDNGQIIAGESSNGAYTFEQALEALWAELETQT